LVSTVRAESGPEVDAALPAIAPAPSLTSPEGASPEDAKSDKTVYFETDDWNELRITVSGYAVNHTAALRAALEEVPELVKPALQQTITISVDGYERALNALD
jgi:hypothetical protein